MTDVILATVAEATAPLRAKVSNLEARAEVAERAWLVAQGESARYHAALHNIGSVASKLRTVDQLLEIANQALTSPNR